MKKNGHIAVYNSLGGKIVIIFSLIIIVIVVLLTIISSTQSRGELYNKAFEQLLAVRSIKANQIDQLMTISAEDLDFIAKLDESLEAYKAVTRYENGGGTNPDGSLNVSSETYREISNRSFREMLTFAMEKFHYYDIFIISWDTGLVLWTVTGESDLGENLATGYLKDSGLGKVWKNVTITNNHAFADFEPYAPSGGEPAAFLGEPVYENGVPVAVVAVQLSIDNINLIMQDRSGMGESGETYLVGPDMLMRSDSFLSPETHTIINSFKDPKKGSADTEMVRKALDGEDGAEIGLDYTDGRVFSSYQPLEVFDVTWAVIAEINQSEIDAPIDASILQNVFWGAGFLIFGIGAAILFSMTISRPILQSVKLANALEQKNLSVNLEEKYLRRKDETGVLANSLNKMKLSLEDIIKEISSGVSNLANSSTDLSQVSDTMNQSVSDTNERTTTVASAIEQMDMNMNNSAAGIEQTSTNLNSVASASTEMNATITEISKNTEKAKEVTDSAVALSNKVSQNINTLGDSAKQIGDVTETISNISSQTNLLALNATIEAARAGTAGKGFAVVAGEIKDLAHQTATATEDIKNRILGIQDAVNLSISDINSVTDVVTQVNQIVNSIAAAIEEQSITTRDISRNINEASTGVGETAKLVAESASVTTDIARNIAEVSDSTHNVASQGEKIVTSIAELNNLADQLKKIVELFKMG